MTDTADLHNAIKGMYNDQLSNEELFEVESSFIGFLELLVSIDKRNKSSNESIKDEQDNRCLHRPNSE